MAYAAFNPDSTLDQAYSENVLDAKVVPEDSNADWPYHYEAGCFKIAFDARVGGTRVEGGDVYLPDSDRNLLGGTVYIDIQEFIDARCGQGFNAIFLNASSSVVPTEGFVLYFLR